MGGGVYLHWWREAAAGEPNNEGGKSTSMAAPGLSAHGSSPQTLPLTLAAGVRVLIVIGSCVGPENANGMPSGSSESLSSLDVW